MNQSGAGKNKGSAGTEENDEARFVAAEPSAGLQQDAKTRTLGARALLAHDT